MQYYNQLKFQFFFLVFLIFYVNEGIAQNQVVNQINILLEEIISESKSLDTLIIKHNSKEPELNREILQAKYKVISDSIIEKKYNSTDSVAIFERRKRIINQISDYTKWESERDRLKNQKNVLSKQIIQYSAIIDLKQSTAEIRSDIEKATKDNKNFNREVIISFATSVRYIKAQAYSESAYNSLSESMVIFEPGTNETTSDWVRNGMNILGIAGGAIAYSGFDNSDNTKGISSIAGTVLVYWLGQKIVNEIKNKDRKTKGSELKRSLEALSRNILYGNIIREDSLNLANFKANADTLFNMIDYVDPNNPSEVKPDWLPSPKIINLSHQLLTNMENSLNFWNAIIVTSNEMLSNSKNFLTDHGKTNLRRNKTKAEEVISIRKDNIMRFRSKLYYLEKQYSEQNKIDKT